MKKPVRILVEVLGPPAIGGTIAFAVFFAKEAQAGVGSAVVLAALSVVYAYAFAFLPSCAYAFAMESAFGAGLKKRSAGAVALSSFLGGLAGFAIGWFFESQVARAAGIYCAVGAATGLTIGGGVALFSKKEAPDQPSATVFTKQN